VLSNGQPLSNGSAKKVTVQTGDSDQPKKLNKADIKKGVCRRDCGRGHLSLSI
jgi:hypothetical protein